MANFFRDNEDLRYYFERGVDWEHVVRLTEKEFHDEGGFSNLEEAREFYGDILELAGQVAAEQIAPYAAELDSQDNHIVDGEVVQAERLEAVFRQLAELELHGLTVPREFGGMNAPMLISFLVSEMLARADVSVMTHHGFHGGMAMAALIFSIREGTTKVDPATMRITETRFEHLIRSVVAGESWGSMDITESDAGSDMAALRCRGELDADGVWHVTGEKIFISSGHGEWHYVIARTEPVSDPDAPMAGLDGLSMFLVPAHRTLPDGTKVRQVEITRLEEKLGHHASSTCALAFDGAQAELIGERGDGFRYMLILMNNARLSVGFESLGLSECAYRMAREYAAERRSMGKTIDRHEMLADYLDEMRSDIEAVRAVAVTAAYEEEIAQKLSIQLRFATDLDDDAKKKLQRKQKRHARAARRLTPLLKYAAAENAVKHARLAVQILGGNGYTKEFGAEKLLRDAMVLPIYEGTSQIQALMAMKDTLMGMVKKPKRFVAKLAEARMTALSARDPLVRSVARVKLASLSAQQHLLLSTAADKAKALRGKPLAEWPERFLKNWDPKRDFRLAMLHAERLARLLTQEAVAELLLEQSVRHPERREVLERYLSRAEISARHEAEVIHEYGERILRSLEEPVASAAAE